MTIRIPRGGACALLLVALAGPARAELELPRPSPSAKVTQTVGLTDITVEYSSPAVRGRKIWGGVVPWDKVWRAGANAVTKVTFSREVKIDGKPVPAGSYALFVIPSTKAPWTVIFSKNLAQAPIGREYKQEEDLLRVQVKPVAIPKRERLAYLVADFTDDAAQLELEWERVRLPVGIRLATTEQALVNIEKANDGAWRPWNAMARYMLESKKDYDAGLAYVEKSLAAKEDWLNDFTKAQLLAAKGRFKEAYPLAQKAMELGKKATPFFLEEEVKKALADWKSK
jgi:hypothetical protein